MKPSACFFIGLLLSSVFHCQTILPGALAQTEDILFLPQTAPLVDLPDDPAAEMVAGIDRFALRHIDQAKQQREKFWQTPDSRVRNLAFLQSRLGISADSAAPDRPPTGGRAPSGGALLEQPDLLAGEHVSVQAIRWPVCAHPAPQLRQAVSWWGEGLLLQPRQSQNKFAIVLPDAGESPELTAGLSEKSGSDSSGFRLVRHLIDHGFTVVIPQLVAHDVMQHGGANLSQREYLHRAAFELGNSLLGYEVEMVQSLLHAFAAEQVAVAGFGEGGIVALHSGALDPRIDITICCGYFGPRESSWRGPLSRNLFGVLERFGDAELGAMIAPRKLIISAAPTYRVSLAAPGGAPAEWASPERSAVELEFQRMQRFAEQQLQQAPHFAHLVTEREENGAAIEAVLKAMAIGPPGEAAASSELRPLEGAAAEEMESRAAARAARLLDGIDAHTQAVLAESDYARVGFMNIGLPRDDLPDASNAVETTTPEAYTDSTERFREIFIEEVIGRFEEPLLPPAVRTRQNYNGQGWTGYDVRLDVFEDVFAYGVLLMPEDIQPGERRPVVVCQHGLEGRPQDTLQGDHYAYHDFAAKLAERGFIVFAPQNPYIGHDDFRTLQRKLNPLGKSLFSVIGPQHQQILNWLSTLPEVDPERIAFYGLSYGGKSAMRLPAMLPQYCLSICSADFNDWVWKNASSRSPYSYIGTGEYEIFEYNLGHTFNYAEMAALIAPRPFMVERGHYDGVAPDERVAKEFARVRFLYAARLGLPERCEIEWFNGPHTINGQGTFEFLHHHTRWPDRSR